jgi:hypothetical protein
MVDKERRAFQAAEKLTPGRRKRQGTTGVPRDTPGSRAVSAAESIRASAPVVCFSGGRPGIYPWQRKFRKYLQLIKCPRRIMSIEFGVDNPIAGRKLYKRKNMAGSTGHCLPERGKKKCPTHPRKAA